MKFDPQYRDHWHQNNLEKTTNRYMSMEDEENGKIGESVPLASRFLFDLPSGSQEEEKTIRNLIKYVSKRYAHTVSRGMKQKQYGEFMATGATTYNDRGFRTTYEESLFSAGHELVHSLVAYLLNNVGGVGANSVVPSYLREEKGDMTILDKDNVRRDYLEEVYATILTFTTRRSNLFSTLHTMRGMTFEKQIMEVVEESLKMQRVNASMYKQLGEEKATKDYEICYDRLLEVVTASVEERKRLKDLYPLECLVYDLCDAYVHTSRTNPKAVWDVYEKYFKRLFNKANASAKVLRPHKKHTKHSHH